MATVGEVIESLVLLLACIWGQWTATNLRLREANKLRRRLRRTYVWFRDGGPMVELGGKGKGKKAQEQQGVMDAILASLEGPLDAAKVLRINTLFQLQDL